MRIVKLLEDGMRYEELGILVIMNDKIDINNIQDDVDCIIGEFENDNIEWFISDVIDKLNDEIGYNCQFFDNRFIGEVII